VSRSVLAGLREDIAEDALRWERHIVEVLTGADLDAEPGTEPRPQYDPKVYSLAQREEANAAELADAGEQVTARTVKRKRQRYETQGLAGLVDWRADRATSVRGRIDERVVDALLQAVNEKSASSTRTASFYLWRTHEILVGKYGPDTVPMPSRASFYRLFERVTEGKHTTGSARTRESLASRPDHPFRQLTAGRPGEIMQIDSTPLDVMVMLDNGLPSRVELTGMVDLATRTITAAVLRPTTKSVDASLLLARTVTPEPMRPGWAEALSMACSVLPHRRLLSLDQRLPGRSSCRRPSCATTAWHSSRGRRGDRDPRTHGAAAFRGPEAPGVRQRGNVRSRPGARVPAGDGATCRRQVGLFGEVYLPSLDAVYRFTTEDIGSLPGVTGMQFTTELLTLKRGYIPLPASAALHGAWAPSDRSSSANCPRLRRFRRSPAAPSTPRPGAPCSTASSWRSTSSPTSSGAEDRCGII
jgi:hypothetical protein